MCYPLPGRGAKMLKEQFLAAFETCIRKHHRFRFSDWIVNHSLLMQSVHDSPIEPFPRASSIVEGEIQQPKRDLVDFVFVVVHSAIVLPLAMIAIISNVPRPTTHAWSNHWPAAPARMGCKDRHG
jgi:hypothetical protein